MAKIPGQEEDAIERYARLNRLVERGDATGASRQQLIRVCTQLGKRDEAIAAFHSIEDPDLRRTIRPELARLGWVEARNAPDEIQALMVTDASLNPSLREKVEDGVRFLGDGGMRMKVLIGTVAFPIVLSLGGVLASTTDFFLVQLIAVLPVLLVVGTMGALGRHVLITTIEGHDDSTGLPEFPQLIRESWEFLVDFAVLCTVFLGPVAALVWLGDPLMGLPLAVVAGLFMPLTTALRLTGTPWRRLTPGRLMSAVRRLSPAYLAVAGTVVLLLAPAILVLSLTAGMPALVVLSVTGPLAVAPALVATRILGLTLHYERHRVGELFTLPGDPSLADPGLRYSATS